MGKFSILITELINEISSADDLKAAIEEYQKNSTEIEKLQASIKDTVADIKKKSNEGNQQLKLIFKFMEDFNISKSEGDGWVAELTKVLKYSYPSASHKELWEAALEKLNLNTKKILLAMENAQLDTKRKMEVPALKVKKGASDKTYKIAENIIDKGLEWIKSKWGGLLKAMKGFKEAVKNLPELNVNEVKGLDDSDEIPEDGGFKMKVKILDIGNVRKVQDIIQDMGFKQPKIGYSDVFTFFNPEDYQDFTDVLDQQNIEHDDQDLSGNLYEGQDKGQGLNIVGNDGGEQKTFGLTKDNKLAFIRPEPGTKVILFDESPERIVKRLKKLFPNVKDIWINPYQGPYNDEGITKAKGDALIKSINKENYTPNKTKPTIDQIKNDLSVMRMDGQTSDDEHSGDNYTSVEFNDLGRWIDDEESGYEREMDGDMDWREDNDNQIWAPGEYKRYMEKFTDWAQSKPWFDKVELSIETGEKNWVTFKVELKND